MLDQGKASVSGQGDFANKIPVCEDRYFFYFLIWFVP